MSLCVCVTEKLGSRLHHISSIMTVRAMGRDQAKASKGRGVFDCSKFPFRSKVSLFLSSVCNFWERTRALVVSHFTHFLHTWTCFQGYCSFILYFFLVCLPFFLFNLIFFMLRLMKLVDWFDISLKSHLLIFQSSCIYAYLNTHHSLFFSSLSLSHTRKFV